MNSYHNNYHHTNLQMGLNPALMNLSDHYLNPNLGLGLSNYSLMPQKSDKVRRNVWTDKKNAALVEIVKKSPYPTPWRPKHGTNKEVWVDIAKQINSMPEIFDFPILWEAAKEQLLKLIDRQKMRRSIGDFEVKNPTEKYIDEMIKHMLAEDAEKAMTVARQKERNENKRLREENKEIKPLPRRRKRSSLKGLSMEELINITKANLTSQTFDDSAQDGRMIEQAFQEERERIQQEYIDEKERIRDNREKERDDLLIQRDQLFLKFVQDQVSSFDKMVKSTENLHKHISQILL
uniref:Uncharacterized protein n=1 Tax=Chromulina nebulosa TaxID=96789 RepID=A0A7S0XF89_9STRA